MEGFRCLWIYGVITREKENENNMILVLKSYFSGS